MLNHKSVLNNLDKAAHCHLCFHWLWLSFIYSQNYGPGSRVVSITNFGRIMKLEYKIKNSEFCEQIPGDLPSTKSQLCFTYCLCFGEVLPGEHLSGNVGYG